MKAVSTVVGCMILMVALAMAPAVNAQLPESKNAPKTGEKAPDFTLFTSDGKSFKLSEALSPKDGKKPNAIVLIFYRGYW